LSALIQYKNTTGCTLRNVPVNKISYDKTRPQLNSYTAWSEQNRSDGNFSL